MPRRCAGCGSLMCAAVIGMSSSARQLTIDCTLSTGKVISSSDMACPPRYAMVCGWQWRQYAYVLAVCVHGGKGRREERRGERRGREADACEGKARKKNRPSRCPSPRSALLPYHSITAAAALTVPTPTTRDKNKREREKESESEEEQRKAKRERDKKERKSNDKNRAKLTESLNFA